MHQTQRQRTVELLQSKGVERALFASLESVKWLTGFAPPIQVGGSPFAGGPTLVWYEDRRFWLILVDGYAADAAYFDQEPDGALVSYPGYTIEQPIRSAENLGIALGAIARKSTAPTGRVGIETGAVTAYLRDVVARALPPGVEMTPIDNWLVPLRMVKTEEELVKLRRNFALTDVGHAAARRTVRAGLREIDVWAAVQSAVNQEAGCRVPLGNDCVVGARSPNNIGGWPLDYEIKPGGSLIVDLSAVHQGYWSDSCATYYPGEPTPRQAAIHRVVQEALEFGISLVRPGAVAREIDRKIREFIEKAGYPPHPHHSGHAVGVSPHEAPRIAPYNDEVLQAGMVIMLEPGVYFPGEVGVRLEDGMLVTADGAEILTKHDKSMK